MTAPYTTDCPHARDGWCRACVDRLLEECDARLADCKARRDEADRERLARRDHERRLNLIKESLRPWFDADGAWDGSLVGLPGIVAGVADRFRELDRLRVACEGFVERHGIGSATALVEGDAAVDAAFGLVREICEIVGYREGGPP